MKKPKKFDCVAMKRQSQEQLRATYSNLPLRERLLRLNDEAAAFRRETGWQPRGKDVVAIPNDLPNRK